MAKKIELDTSIIKCRQQKDTVHRIPKKLSCRILIVCEGEKTEPSYFKKFQTIRNNSFVYEVTCEGGKINTMQVVNKAISLREKAKIKYDSVWAVFDKDDYPSRNFNGAIQKAVNNGINVAWSNEAFELWYLYHFINRVTPMSRKEYEGEITKAVNKSKKWKKKKPYVYKKNDPENYNIMSSYGNIENAIKWAKATHKEYHDMSYANHNPCTTVYLLVEQLLNKDLSLIQKVMDKINNNKS